MKTTLDEMQVFIAVVDSGSITAAADMLGQAVSAASRAMSRLEEKLQTTLMRRTTRRLALTEEGRAYLEQARKIVAAVKEAEELTSLRRNQPAGLLRVDAASPFMLHVVVPLVPGYCRRYPRVELELTGNEGNIDLLERRTDLAIRIGRQKGSSLHAVPLGRRGRVLASPAYLDRNGVPKSVADLASHRLLGFSQLEALNEWPLLDVSGQPLRVAPALKSFNGETLRQLFAKQTLEVRQPINAVYYRSTAVSSRIKSFIDCMAGAPGPRGFE